MKYLVSKGAYVSDIKSTITEAADTLPWLITGAAGMLGRLMFHAKQVQRGIRKPFSWVLLWDIPIALGMGWVALGLGAWLHVQWETTVSIALVAAYMGPYGMDSLFAKWADWKFGGTNGQDA